jgi:hypothetical protein
MVLGNCTKYCGEEAPNVGDVAHITICLAKSLQILGGDKNGLHYICLGWNLQTLELVQPPEVLQIIFDL